LKKALEIGISLHRGSIEDLEGGSFTGNHKGYVNEGSRNEYLSTLGPSWATWKGTHLPGTLRQMKEGFGNGVSLWELCEGNLKGGSFTRDHEGYVKEGSGDRQFFPQGPCWGTWKGDHLPETLKDGGGL
jgi:hypothetical protein